MANVLTLPIGIQFKIKINLQKFGIYRIVLKLRYIIFVYNF